MKQRMYKIFHCPYIRKAIEDKIDESKKSIIDLREASKRMGLDSAIGRLSRMDYINNKSITESELLKAESRLKELEGWLSIYDTDRFGKCTRCGQEIHINRLLLLPEVHAASAAPTGSHPVIFFSQPDSNGKLPDIATALNSLGFQTIALWMLQKQAELVNFRG